MAPGAGKHRTRKNKPTAPGKSNLKRAQNHLRRDVLICLALCLAVLAVFGQTCRFEFVTFDDDTYITDNPDIEQGLSRAGITWAFTSLYADFWHPLTWLSLLADYELYGLNPAGYHMTNVVLHAASAVVLFLALKQMTRAAWQSAFVAALFALHPLHVESVAWVSERKDVLSGLFWMLTLWAYGWYAEKTGWRRYLLVVAGFVLGMMAKPMLVTLPCVLLLLDYWPLRRIRAEETGYIRWRDLRKPILEKIPLFVLAVGFAALVWQSHHTDPAAPVEVRSFSVRCADALATYGIYIAKTLWPAHLVPFYRRLGVDTPVWQAAAGLLLLVGLSAAAVGCARKRPYLTVGWLWYVGTLLPVIDPTWQKADFARADRYTYLTITGLFIIVAWGVSESIARSRRTRTTLGVLTLLVLLGLVVGAFRQTSHWRDSETLYGHMIRANPENYLAHYNLGKVCVEKGKNAAAIHHFRETFRVLPGHVGARNNLGILLYDLGRIEEAAQCFADAARIKPDYFKTHFNLGVVLAEQNKADEAIAAFTTAVQLEPDEPQAHFFLGNLFFAQGRIDQTIAHYRETIRIVPNHAKTHANLGVALARRGDLDAAVEHLSEALRLKPDHVNARYNLGNTYLQQGRLDEAAAELAKVLELTPDDELTRSLLEGIQAEKERVSPQTP